MEEEPVEPDSGVDVEECEVEPNACALQEPLNLRLGFTTRLLGRARWGTKCTHSGNCSVLPWQKISMTYNL